MPLPPPILSAEEIERWRLEAQRPRSGPVTLEDCVRYDLAKLCTTLRLRCMADVVERATTHAQWANVSADAMTATLDDANRSERRTIQTAADAMSRGFVSGAAVALALAEGEELNVWIARVTRELKGGDR